jgi:hypothetical protein
MVEKELYEARGWTYNLAGGPNASQTNLKQFEFYRTR